MLGDPTMLNPREKGLAWYIIEDLLEISKEQDKKFQTRHDFELSFVEIYNEHVFDLLSATKENLMVIED
jgi:hypothetical protein